LKVFGLVVLMLLFCFGAQAYSFKIYEGRYQVIDQINVIADGDRRCTRFFFPQMVGLEVREQGDGLNQTHVLLLTIEQGNGPFQVIHPIQEFRNINENGDLLFADTYGGFNYAENKSGYKLNDSEMSEKTTMVGLSTYNGAYSFYMRELWYKNGKITDRCEYNTRLAEI
jgi:hypothetical protein